MYHSLREAIADAEGRGISLATAALDIESRDQGRPVEVCRGAAAGRLTAAAGSELDSAVADGNLHCVTASSAERRFNAK